MSKTLVYPAIFFAIALSGCATQRNHKVSPQPVVVDAKTQKLETSSSGTLAHVPRYQSKFGKIDLDMNSYVRNWVDYFQGKGRRHMLRYLERSSRYLPMMKGVLRENGLPEDLVYIALIESGFNAVANSHANAVGYWQFIRETGRRYGLRIDAYVDERRDPVLSTHAAAQYFKALYNLFGSWHLAMASYNTGENRVKRIVMKYGTRNFWDIVKRKKLPRETRNYVPKFIAATLIAKNPQRYGFTNVNFKPALNYETISLRNPMSLSKFARTLGISTKDMKLLNPKFRGDYVPLFGRGTVVRVPTGMKMKAQAAAAQSKMSRPKQYAYGGSYFYYRVRRGDNLSYLAKRFRTSMSKIRRLNNMRSRSFLRIGQRLKMPEGSYIPKAVASSGSKARSRRSSVSSSRSRNSSVSTSGTHKVKRGESLSTIAEKYGVGLSKLRAANRMTRRSMIRIGQRLKVPNQKLDGSSRVSSTSRGGGSVAYHQVRRGENLSLIAQKYKTSVSRLKQLNKLGRKSMIRVGQRLKVPTSSSHGSKVHIVRSGETLSHIAQRYRVSLARLTRVNSISTRSMINVGKKLTIP